jgi:two-component system, NtrC family, nitrogen regulation response regulator GlnG
MSHVLIIDDEPAICWAFRESLSDDGHAVSTAGNAEEALRQIQQQTPDVVVLDVRLPGQDGLSLLRQLRKQIRSTPIIMMTAFGSLDVAVNAIDGGAFDYLPKPFDLDQAVAVVGRALASRSPAAKPGSPSTGRTAEPPDTIVGSSPPMQAIFRKIALLADSDVSVLITGESGTGKELVAEAIHRHSPRREEPFVPVCVPALSATVLESELFGHVKGAFTGADHDRTGLLDLAAQGTAFFDEVGDVPLGLQVKLLRAMERQEVTPVGSTQSHRANFRLIAATNRDLTAMVAEGTFREDLFYRLNVFHLELPPLRDRREDIPPLVQHFLDQLPRKDGAEPMSLTDETLAELTRREWPGNVRELRNVVEHAAIVARGGTITPECLPATQATPTEQSSFDAALRDWVRGRLDRLESDAAANVYEELLECCEPVLFEQALNHAGGNRSAAARLLGIHRETLRQKLRKYFVDMD